MERINFSENIFDEYENISRLLLKIKFLYLKISNNYSISNDKKDLYNNLIKEISIENKKHFEMLKQSKINELNIDDFEKKEKNYLNDTKRKLNRIIKEFTKAQTIKPVDFSEINRIDVDAKLINNKISEKHSISTNDLNNLNLYQKNGKIQKRKEISIELINLKAQEYEKNLTEYNIKNADLFYKMKLKIEKVLLNKEINFQKENEAKNTLSFYEEGNRIIVKYNEKPLAAKFECFIKNDTGIRIDGEIIVGEDKIELFISQKSNKQDLQAFIEALSLKEIYEKVILKYDEYKNKCRTGKSEELRIKDKISKEIDYLL